MVYKTFWGEMLEILGILILACIIIAMSVTCVAGIFAAPGYVILLMMGVPIGFWKSAIVGFGSLMLIGAVAGGVRFTIKNLKD